MPDARAAMPTMPEIARGLVAQDAGAVDAIGERPCVDQQRDQTRRTAARSVADGAQSVLRPAGGRSRVTPPSAIVPRSSRVPNSRSCRPHEPFAQGLRTARRHGERHVRREGADVRDVVVDALQLEQHHAQRVRAGRHLDAGEPFDRVRVGERVADGRVPGDRFGEEQAVCRHGSRSKRFSIPLWT